MDPAAIKARLEAVATRLAEEGKSKDEIRKAIEGEIHTIVRQAQYRAWNQATHENLVRIHRLAEED